MAENVLISIIDDSFLRVIIDIAVKMSIFAVSKAMIDC